MEIKSIKDKERYIVGTVINCNQEIKNLSGLINKPLNEHVNVYHFNMVSLYESIMDLNNSPGQLDLNTVPSYVQNPRGNYYSYFNKVYDFLDGYAPNIQKNLNESLVIDGNENDIQLDIVSFKNDLKKIIDDLSKQDDIENLSDEILKIKAFAKKPLFLYGYDLLNSLPLQKELQEKFNISNNDLIAIVYDKTNKQLIFVTALKLVGYMVSKDELGLIETGLELTAKNYYGTIKEKLENNNLIELFVDFTKMEFKFTDNVYLDNMRKTFDKKRNSVVK